MDVNGKRVLVTGAGTGIGKGIAMEFARRGARVVLHYSHSSRGAEETGESIRRAGGEAHLAGGDFTNLDAVKRVGASAIDALGGLDVLINNAGITFNKRIEDVTPEQFEIYKHWGKEAGFKYVASGPYVRSSYFAEEVMAGAVRMPIG